MLDPATINPFELPFVLLEERSQFPTVSCVYLAIDSNGVIQYIGQSTCLKGRWTNHHKLKQLKALGEKSGCNSLARSTS